MRELYGACRSCGTDLSGQTIATLEPGDHGAACPECGQDVYSVRSGDLTVASGSTAEPDDCPECGDLTTKHS
jgi:predicted RNA-binding Zn-ribbon protein involved in translation (DUF1610 family)